MKFKKLKGLTAKVKAGFGAKKSKKYRIEDVEKFIKIGTVAAANQSPLFVDAKNMCYPISFKPTLDPIAIISEVPTVASNPLKGYTTVVLPDEVIESFYKMKLPSFTPYSKTGNITMTINNMEKLIKSYNNYIHDLSRLTGQPYETISKQVLNYHATKKIFLQPSGLSGILYKTTNSIYAGEGFVHAIWSTGASHLSAVGGASFLAANPSLVLITPLVCGASFALLERLTVGTPFQTPCAVGRDVCLIPVKIGEICHNEFGLGRVLRFMNIDAPLNITSILSFGNGTQEVLGKTLNATLEAIKQANPQTLWDAYRDAYKLYQKAKK